MTLPAHVQRLADLLLQALGVDIHNGSLTLHFGDGRVQSVKHESYYKLPAKAEEESRVVVVKMC